MIIRRAEHRDIPSLLELLSQVLSVHAAIRPDIFIAGTTKYTAQELEAMVLDDARPIFVAADEEEGAVLGYAFCALQKPPFTTTMIPRTTLYLDDLCVDTGARGRHVGTALCDYVIDYAREQGCADITLNVWEGNDAARAFYDRYGFRPKETTLEYRLDSEA